jgi:hypothetical protein
MVPLHRVVPGAVTRLIAAQPHSAGKVEAAWRLAVGAALARLTRASRAEAGIVVVEVLDRHVVRELESHRGLIEPRLQAMLGAHGRSFRVLCR